MKRQFLCTIFSLFLAMTLLTACSNKEADTYDHDGEPVHLTEYQGKWIVVNYWASWCAPCLKEIKELNKLYDKYHEQGVEVLGVSYDPLSTEQIEEFKQLYHVNYPMMQSFPHQKYGVKAVEVVPTTLIIDPKGHLRQELLGPQTLASLEAEVKLTKREYRIRNEITSSNSR